MKNRQKAVIVTILIATAVLAALIVLNGKPRSGHDHAQTEADHQHERDNENGQPQAMPARREVRIKLSGEQIEAAGIVILRAGPARLQNVLTLPGEIKYNEDRTAHVVPKITGVVEAVHADLGQKVKKGQVLAVIASSTISERRGELLTAQQRLELARSTHAREKKLWEEKISAEQDYLHARQALHEAEIALRNARQKLAALGPGGMDQGPLNRYRIRAPFDGMVMEKHITLGETVKEDASIFTISDLSTVWTEIAIPAQDINNVYVGEQATVRAAAFESTSAGKISYVGSLLGEQTRSAKGRIVLANPRGAWRPGLFVSVDIATNEAEVPVTVATDAIQTLEGKTVVFVRGPDGFIAQPVTTGRGNGRQVEIVTGMRAGADYAASGSFVLKAEHGKGEAEHRH